MARDQGGKKVEMGLERKELSCPSNNGATLGSLSVISKAEIPAESTRDWAWGLVKGTMQSCLLCGGGSEMALYPPWTKESRRA